MSAGRNDLSKGLDKHLLQSQFAGVKGCSVLCRRAGENPAFNPWFDATTAQAEDAFHQGRVKRFAAGFFFDCPDRNAKPSRARAKSAKVGHP